MYFLIDTRTGTTTPISPELAFKIRIGEEVVNFYLWLYKTGELSYIHRKGLRYADTSEIKGWIPPSTIKRVNAAIAAIDLLAQ